MTRIFGSSPLHNVTFVEFSHGSPYPNVHVEIGGYTDNTGDPAANMALSDARAKNVMAVLVNKSIDPSKLKAEGYGDQHPVGDNSTEEGRAKNRRITLRVTQK